MAIAAGCAVALAACAGTPGALPAVGSDAQVTPIPSQFGRRVQGQVMPAPAAVADVDCHQVKCVALTFDDGPGPQTARLLSSLARYGARATFFVVGQNAVTHPDLVRAERFAGHDVGNHSWSHPDLTRLSPTAVARQLTRTDDAIRRATGETATLVRPPYGAVDTVVRRQAGRPVILWDVDPQDWKLRDVAEVVSAVVDAVKPGDIVLLHDIRPSMVAAVPAILRSLRERGYHCVTVSRLMAGTPLLAGRSYRRNAALRHGS